MRHDLINDAIVSMRNNERVGKPECIVRPVSKLLLEILKVIQKEGYIGEFELNDDNTGGEVRIKLVKQINDCGIIKPRFSVKAGEMLGWEKRYLPSHDFGVLVLTTSGGVMSNKEAREKNLGGKLLVYIY